MTVHYEELIRVVATLCENKHLKASVVASLKGGLITGASAVVGGILLGPIGLAIGGLIGGVTAATTSEDFKSVAQILRELPREKKIELANRLKNAFKDFNVKDAVVLLPAHLGLQEVAIREVTDFLGTMSYSVKSG